MASGKITICKLPENSLYWSNCSCTHFRHHIGTTCLSCKKCHPARLLTTDLRSEKFNKTSTVYNGSHWSKFCRSFNVSLFRRYTLAKCLFGFLGLHHFWMCLKISVPPCRFCSHSNVLTSNNVILIDLVRYRGWQSATAYAFWILPLT